MASFNRVMIMGNLTRDPEYKQLSSGQALCRLGLASNRQFKNKQTGALVQEVCFVDVDVWGPQAESCRQYLQKGRGIMVEGRLKFDTWQDQEGGQRSKHTVVADRVIFMGSAPSEDFAGKTDNRSQNQSVGDEAIESALRQQIDEVKARTQEKVAEKPQPKEADAKKSAIDEPPFKDDLPF